MQQYKRNASSTKMQLWRVRVGPYATDADARVALGWVISAGAADAQVVID